MKVGVVLTATISGAGTVELPEGRTWDDVKSFYVKWGGLYVDFKDGTSAALDAFGIDYDLDSIDHKYPGSVTIHPTDENGNIDYNDELDSI